MEHELKRRGLSGIYIFDQFPDETKRQPTCIEDCHPETRKKLLESKEKEWLISCVESLCDTLVSISDQFGIIAQPKED